MLHGLIVRAIAMFLFGAACTAAFAGPPFLTDDPEPVDLHQVEVNVISQQTRALVGRSGSVSGEVNLGCATETQCHLALPVAFNDPVGGRAHARVGDVELGVKYRFVNRRDDGWSASVYPTLYLPTARQAGVSATDARSSCSRCGYNGPPANGHGTPVSPDSSIRHPTRAAADSLGCSDGDRLANG